MYIRFSTLLPVAALAAVAAAMPTPGELAVRNGGSSECNTGPIQCCNQVMASNNPVITELFGLLGIVVPGLSGQVGLNCSPIGGGVGSSCSAQPVCCNGNTFNGLINIGCNPIIINL